MLCWIMPAAGDTFGDIVAPVVVRVYDGDTFFVDLPDLHPVIGDEIGIRVRGIDTPEIRGSCDDERRRARSARDRAQEILRGAEVVILHEIERGRYFRIVATVLVDGRDLGEMLIAEGHARPYDGTGARGGWCE